MGEKILVCKTHFPINLYWMFNDIYLLLFSIVHSCLQEEVESEGEDAKEGQVTISKKNCKEDFQNKEQLTYSEFKGNVRRKE